MIARSKETDMKQLRKTSKTSQNHKGNSKTINAYQRIHYKSKKLHQNSKKIAENQRQLRDPSIDVETQSKKFSGK